MNNCKTDKANRKVSLKSAATWWDKKVDAAFNKVEDILQKYDKNGYLIPTKDQQDLADMLTYFNASRQNILSAADDIKKYLDTFTQEQSADIVRALNGDKLPGELKGQALETYKRLRALIDKNAKDLVDAGLLDADNVIEDYVKRFYQQHLSDQSLLSKIFQSKTFKRKDLSYDERVAIGMIEDASYVVPRTIADQRMQLLRGEFLAQTNEKFGEDAPIADDYVEVPDVTYAGGLKKYGALGGRFIPKSVFSALNNAHMLSEELGFLERHIYPLVDHIKVNVTVKNPVTHIYNIASNLQVATIDGSLGHVGKILLMARNDKAQFKELMDEARNFGLDSMIDDMQDVEVYSSNGTVNVAMTLLNNLYLGANSTAGKKVRKIYDWEDKIFKLASYAKAKEDAIAAGVEPTKENLHEIYKNAVLPYANYSTPLPGAIRLLDKTGASPFLHYVYKATPGVAKLIAKHPFKYAAIQYALVLSGASIWSDEDEALKPEWAGSDSKINLFGAKDWASFGNGWYWNAGRMMPGLKIGAVDMGGGFIGGTINIVNGKTPLGYDINSQYDGVAKKASSRFLTLAENYAPPVTFGRYGQRGTHMAAAEFGLAKPKQNYYKEDMTFEEFASRAVGVRKFNESDEVRKKLNKAENRLNYYLKNDPNNAAVHRAEYKARVAEIKRQARAKKVKAKENIPKPRTPKVISPIKLGF